MTETLAQEWHPRDAQEHQLATSAPHVPTSSQGKRKLCTFLPLATRTSIFLVLRRHVCFANGCP